MPAGALLRLLIAIAAPFVCSASSAQVITESGRDFSAMQGSAGWSYGFSTNPFNVAAFRPLEIYATNIRGQIGWMHSTNQPPWTRVTRDGNASGYGCEPGGMGGAALDQRGERPGSPQRNIAKAVSNANPGQDGITGSVLVDGAPVYTRLVAANNTAGYDFALELRVAVGTVIDFAVSANENISWMPQYSR
jgi:hypothetical protein